MAIPTWTWVASLGGLALLLVAKSSSATTPKPATPPINIPTTTPTDNPNTWNVTAVSGNVYEVTKTPESYSVKRIDKLGSWLKSTPSEPLTSGGEAAEQKMLALDLFTTIALFKPPTTLLIELAKRIQMTPSNYGLTSLQASQLASNIPINL